MKPEVLNITTPVCLFQFAWLVEPDTKFDASGIWQVECLIHPDDATEVEEQLSGLLERWKAQLKTANPNKKFKLASLPWEFTEVDGKPYFKVKTKMKGGGVRADGTQWKQRPPVLFNADGSPMTEEQKEKVNKCGPGTTGQVNMRCSGWETAAFGVGIKIQPEAVIIHNHVEYIKTAQGYGFETEEATHQIEVTGPTKETFGYEPVTVKKAGFETVGADEF